MKENLKTIVEDTFALNTGATSAEYTTLVTQCVIDYLKSRGYDVKQEYKIEYYRRDGKKKNGRIDIIGINDKSEVVAIEIDRSNKMNSLAKLITLKQKHPAAKCLWVKWRASEKVEEVTPDTKIFSYREWFKMIKLETTGVNYKRRTR